MKILALIPARGGSKRLPGKNIRDFGGKPLINWSIEVAKNIPEICDTVVSTDEIEIAKICKSAGALVPWLRPANLATDTASSVDVAIHALNWYESERGPVDGLLMLQPTSPFRRRKTINNGIKLFIDNNGLPVLGVSPVQSHPMWTLKIEGEYLVPFMFNHGLNNRSQDLPETYIINGCFYLISSDDLRFYRSFVGPKTIPLLIESPKEALDIDTEWDWEVAKAALNIIDQQITSL
jgi:CMP-N,N'-diacetyllegionaminic acid synthase